MSEQDKGQDWRDDEPFDYKRYRNFYQLAGGLFITAVILLIGGFNYSDPKAGYWVNIYATIVGTVLTIAVLDRRAEHRATRERKQELILQMGSPDNGFAVEAVRLLRQKGWLWDGSLQSAYLERSNLMGANLMHSNLPNVNLSHSNLQGVNLSQSNLQNANLMGSNLEKAYLFAANLQNTSWVEANLQGVHLNDANLQDSLMWNANLQGAFLDRSNLCGADLLQVNLINVWLMETKFSSETILPDGSNWTPNRDMREFTHPEEWRTEQTAKQSSDAP